MSQTQEVTPQDLKIQAQRETIAELQDKNADLRVELTVLAYRNQELQRQLEELRASTEANDDEPLADDTAN